MAASFKTHTVWSTISIRSSHLQKTKQKKRQNLHSEDTMWTDWLWERFFLNQYLENFSILYPLKTLENLWFCNVLWVYKMGTLVRNGLIPVGKYFFKE